ncbi:MAG: class I SAM-dependent rRNA methyltransferase [Elusimicrobia bacterium]|nr:class I SAM-dependent rRNA methyltransferase [Elusimicrobiota bacterium]
MKFPKVKLSHAPAGPNAFRRMVDSCELALPGDVVAVYDKNGSPYGLALYNPRSQIMLRIFTRDNPETFDIDAFLKKQVTKAVSFRRDILGLERSTNAFRLVHDYGDGLPGLTVDIYGTHIVLEFYSLGMYKLAARLEAAFREHFPKAVFHHRSSSYTQEMEGFSMPPDASALYKARVNENGVLFDVSFSGGHKTGFFCDQRENRLYTSTFAGGKSVLDICAYTGGFGLYAKKLGGAEEVTCVELDAEASELSKRNANINNVRVDSVCSDAFPYMRQMAENGKKYGLVILDPYKLVSSREEREKGIFKYKDFNRIAMSLVEEGGVFVTCSCSGMVSMEEFSYIVRGAASTAGRRAQIFKKSGAGPDHPIAADYPEGEYLKVIWARM